MKIINGAQWKDTSGQPIHCHGGQIWQEKDTFYWIGENRSQRTKVSCYASKDLVNWVFRNHILTLDSKKEKYYVDTDLEIEYREKEIPSGQLPSGVPKCSKGCNIERPKILYNSKTKKYVMWGHFEFPAGYEAARCFVATCDTVDGDYTYHGSFNPLGHMSRDCTLYQLKDGTAYFISAARDNADTHIYRLSEDYLSIDEQVKALWSGQFREAPAVFEKDETFYMLSSYCTGWHPNQSKYAYSGDIEGRWSSLRNFGDDTTFKTQPTWVLPIKGTKKTTYLYISDRWDAEDYYNSSYVFLPVSFKDNGEIFIEYREEFDIDVVTGEVK